MKRIPLLYQWLGAVVLLATAFFVVRLYGDRREDRGRRDAELFHTDSVRLRMAAEARTAQLSADSALARVVRQRDSLSALNLRLIARVDRSEERARKALDQLNDLPDSILVRTDPSVRIVIDSLRVSNIDLQNLVVSIRDESSGLYALVREDSVALARLEHSRDIWKAAYDSAAKEIGQWKRKKDPPRCGMKCGGVLGATVAAILTLLLGHR